MSASSSTAPARALRAAAGAFLCLGLAAAAQDPAPPPPPAELAADATNVLAAVSARYAAATNVSCTVRRGVAVGGTDGGAAEAVSRVVWARGDRLNVQRLAPDRRRTLVDGETVRVAAEGEREPSSFPVAEQLPTQAANLRAVPASPEEHLAFLDPATARDVEPAAAPFARQVSFRPAGEHPGLGLTVVSFDADGCVARIETFATGTRLRPVSATEFSSPLEPLPGLRLFRRIETTTTVEGREVRTASSFDRLRVNEELPPSIFDPKAFF